ncbi:putative ribokinase [Neophaeococcomyces mojaviensis]|uniref:Ribokinase n=1 Tax=Neophaeococcomyces mojaviensis TaxID=3383035 RepID=A0ACC2ZTZ1_9EURO|nr:putative ribokinase [Knufia sp. JES_112]
MAKPLIQVIGSLHLDFVTTTPRCPSAGETLQASRFDINAGGKGANQAAACGRAAFTSETEQDVEVEMIGAVGKDDPYYATLLQPALGKSGVSTKHVVEVVGTNTGSATIIVDEGAGGENRILFVPGAGFKGMDDVNEVLTRSTSGGKIPDVVVLQGEIPRQTVLSIVEHYNGNEKTQVVFNPAPVWPQGIPGRTLKGLTTLIINETECLLLVKSMSAEGYHMEAVEKEEDLTKEVLEEIASEFHELLNIRTVIVTLGAKGVFYSQYLGSRGYLSAEKVEKVVDTTAAGDTFVGYFAAELARASARGEGEKDFNVEAACKKANVAAAKCVSRSGAMQSIPFGYET